MKTIQLTQGQVALVDDEDFERLSMYKWHAVWATGIRSFYAARTTSRSSNRKRIKIFMHREVMGVTDREIQVDHINHNTLDNRRSELRITTCRGNKSNLKGKGDSSYSSSRVGVTWHKSHQKWMAQILCDGKNRYLGYFASEAEASEAYQKALLEVVPNG